MKNRLLVVLSLLLFALTAGVNAAVAQEEYGGHYYEVITDAKTWVEADAAANQAVIYSNGETYQGHLAVITSAEENAFVYELIKYGPKRAWIGGHQDYQVPGAPGTSVSAGWRWVNGEPFETNYKNWDKIEPPSPCKSPNDAGPVNAIPYYCYEDNGENCMEMRGYGYWDDMNCTTTMYSYVIEYEPPIEQASIDFEDQIWIDTYPACGMVGDVTGGFIVHNASGGINTVVTISAEDIRVYLSTISKGDVEFLTDCTIYPKANEYNEYKIDPNSYKEFSFTCEGVSLPDNGGKELELKATVEVGCAKNQLNAKRCNDWHANSEEVLVCEEVDD